MKMSKEKLCLCALNRIFGFEPKIALALLNHLGSATEIFELGAKDLEYLLGPHSAFKDQIVHHDLAREANEMEVLSQKGIRFTGLAGNKDELEDNNPLIIRVKGISLALINLTYGTNQGAGAEWPRTNYIGEKEKTADAFAAARKKGADYIIALPHWGTEYELRHSKVQEKTAQWLAGQGADFIIGAHPHVVQDIGMVGNIPVAYSLGNAVSNMSAAKTQLELMVTIRIIRQCNGDLTAMPMELDYLWCSRPGGFNGCYTVIPVAEYIGKKALWQNSYDYDKMISTYERVRKETE